MSANLLVELLTEELPPRALQALGRAFGEGIANGLRTRDLLEADSVATTFCTPRRLAVHLTRVRETAPDKPFVEKLMPVNVGLKDGKATPALLKKLAAKQLSHLDPASLGREHDGKTEQLVYRDIAQGSSLKLGLQSAIETAIAELPIPKVMSYQLADGATTVHFVRPAHGLVALHGNEVVKEVSVLGLTAGRVTAGHRFQGVQSITIASADAYQEALAAHGKLIASFDDRRADILAQLQKQAAQLGATLGAAADYEPLLEEVTALVEMPTVYAGAFEAEYLSVPQECLVLTMRANQKYFPLFDAAGKLTNRFLIVSNMRLADPKNIIEGNQRVIRPRLADARFFFDTDKKARLEERVPELARIVYHNKLGSQLERTTRVQILAGVVARAIGADPVLSERAAWLAKADLLTHMVGEFPELQGTMGRYYALADGEPRDVADAIEAHYLPRHAGDQLPQELVACAIALADRLDALCGLFSLGQQPSGDKDPFALRRAALGVIRILVENQLAVSLLQLVDAAFEPYSNKTQGDLREFFIERMRSYFLERGYTANEVEAVLSKRTAEISTLPKKLEAVRAFSALPEAASLAAANKRIANILRQAESKGEALPVNASRPALKDPAEIALFEALQAAIRTAKPLFDSRDFAGYLKTFAALKNPVDTFFEKVMVMVDDKQLRENRLALLSDMRNAMNLFADISKLAA